MLHGHFCSVLHLLQTQAVQLGQRSGSHRASRAHLCLAATFRTGDGGVVLDQSADDTGSSQTTEDLIVGQMPGFLHIPQNRRQNTAGTTGGSGYDHAVVRILLGYGKCVGADLTALTNLGHFGGQLLVVQILCLALHTQTTGQGAGGLQTIVNGLLHGVPDDSQEIPNFGTFVQFHIFRQGVQIAPLAEVVDFCKGMFGVNIFAFHIGTAQDADITTTNGFHTHIADFSAFLIGDEIQGVGMGAGQGFLGENDLRGNGGEHLVQNAVRTVTNTGLAQRAVEDHLESICIGMLVAEDLGSASGAHGVGRRRANANLIYISDGFHNTPPLCRILCYYSKVR